tara:strand:- start:59 stop:721 length:663 start_codon:yes stop_codon:yes gene_type:complete
MKDLMDKGSVSRGWLGVGIQDVSQDLAKAFKLKNTKGSLITAVMEDTPAQKAGMLKGDVVVSINNKEIRNSNHLRNEIANAGAFTEIDLELIREGKSVNIKLKLDKRPQNVGISNMKPKLTPAVEQVEFLGMTVKELTDKNAEKLGVKLGIGVLISKIESGSPAEKAGLLTGMIIQEVERKAVKNIDIFKKILNEMDSSKGVLLLVSNSSGSRYIFIEEE